ncbi:hypothetical protein [uncultured Planktosalinus sp.]|uniref:hypothetical protein n=1 Tax=uncultured Planktosalinus sp. TaxID=1810935 RepID=UPI0030DD4B85
MTNIIILISILVSGALTIFLLNWIVNYKIRKKISENENPLTINLFKAILFTASGILLSELITTFETLTKVLPSSFTGNELILNEISYYCIFLGILVVIIFTLLWISTLLFRLLSKGENVYLEVANNNLKSVLFFAGIIFALTITIKTGITPLLDQLIPYPTMPLYR